MRDFYLILNILVATTLMVLGLVAWISNRKNLLNNLFLIFCACVGLWLVSASVSNDVRIDSDIALYAKYAVFLFSFMSSYLLLWFAVLLSSGGKLPKWLKLSAPPVLAVGLVSATPLVVAGVEPQATVYAVVFGPLVWLYALVLMSALLGSLVVLALGLQKVKGHVRSQIKSLLWALSIAVPILLITQFIAPSVTGSFEVTDVGILVMALPVASLYFGVVKHGLFDVKLAAVRTVAYVMSLLALALAYYLLATLVSFIFFYDRAASNHGDVSLFNILLALVLAFMFQPIKSFFDKVTNRIFYRDNYDEEEFIGRFTHALAAGVDLRRLLEKSARELSDTLKSDQVFFVVYAGEKSVMSGTSGFKRLSPKDAREIKDMMGVKEGVIVAERLESDCAARRLLINHRVSLAIQLRRGKEVIGYLMLGEHKGRAYTIRDLRVLDTISGELSIAIQNALAVQEIKDLNANLQQRIDEATDELRRSNAELQRLDQAKDDFVSMASHQLRTPLTSVKGYISMVLDGDAGKITPEQKKLLSEAFTSSDRMVHLINDFLNVSRLQTGKFMLDRQLTDVSKMVKQEVDSLASTAKARDLVIKYVAPNDIPGLYIDEGKVRQVVMNFIDNAMYYSPPRADIYVRLAIDDGKLMVTVEDSGIGVPESEQDNLFKKFFRATNARRYRPDGTGVGLFLAKRVIYEHGGRIIFKSKEGEGSTFGFSLPIKRLSLAPRDDSN